MLELKNSNNQDETLTIVLNSRFDTAEKKI
jgi:hypothetical protein